MVFVFRPVTFNSALKTDLTEGRKEVILMSDAAPGGLDRMQLAAVEHAGGPVEVIAGPGAGKTMLLVERAARLHEKGTPLSGIVLVTFTTRAAAEMRHRLQVRLGMDLDGQALRSASTIHALAYRILRAAKKSAGDSGWRVADEREAFDVLRQAMTETGAPRELYSPVEMARQVETLLNLSGDADPAADPSVSATLRRYRQILAARRRWDVSELVPRASETMARNGEIANLFRGTLSSPDGGRVAGCQLVGISIPEDAAPERRDLRRWVACPVDL